MRRLSALGGCWCCLALVGSGCHDAPEPTVCALFVEQSDGHCSRPADDPCISQDPDCVTPPPARCPENCPVIDICLICEDGSCAAPNVSCNPDGSCGKTNFVCPSDVYDPCAGKPDGERCTLCDPTDPECVETDVIKECQAGECVAAGASSCSNQGESCANGQACCGELRCCAGVPVPAGREFCGTICPISDRNMKQDVEPIDNQTILERVAELPISAWSYKTEPARRHIGPMAQDFMATFGVGSSDRTILQVDADGVALAAIQALNQRVERLERENQALQVRLAQSDGLSCVAPASSPDAAPAR